MDKKLFKFIEVIIWVVIIIGLNIVSYFLETQGLDMSRWASLFLRISTVIIDVVFVLYIRKLRIYYRKKFRANFPKQTRTIFWLADTATLLLVFYSLYALKITFLVVIRAISLESFLYALSGGLLIAIIFGRPVSWFIKKHTRTIANFIKSKLLRKENEWSISALFYLAEIFLFSLVIPALFLLWQIQLESN